METKHQWENKISAHVVNEINQRTKNEESHAHPKSNRHCLSKEIVNGIGEK
jgi:hypothetical protein